MKTKINQLENLFKEDSDFIELQNISSYIPEGSEIYDFDSLDEILNENDFFCVEIMYYYKAMQYLMEHDNSLHESMYLAHELGYTCKDLNSEILASLLYSEKLREEFFNYKNEINKILEN